MDTLEGTQQANHACVVTTQPVDGPAISSTGSNTKRTGKDSGGPSTSRIHPKSEAGNKTNARAGERLRNVQRLLALCEELLEEVGIDFPALEGRFNADADDLKAFSRHLDERIGLVGGGL